jgi:hypothetical protein
MIDNFDDLLGDLSAPIKLTKNEVTKERKVAPFSNDPANYHQNLPPDDDPEPKEKLRKVRPTSWKEVDSFVKAHKLTCGTCRKHLKPGEAAWRVVYYDGSVVWWCKACYED